MRSNPSISAAISLADSVEEDILYAEHQIMEVMKHGVSMETNELCADLEISEPGFSLALMGLLLNGCLRMEPQLLRNGVILRWLTRGLAADLDDLALANLKIDPAYRFSPEATPPVPDAPERYPATGPVQQEFVPPPVASGHPVEAPRLRSSFPPRPASQPPQGFAPLGMHRPPRGFGG